MLWGNPKNLPDRSSRSPHKIVDSPKLQEIAHRYVIFDQSIDHMFALTTLRGTVTTRNCSHLLHPNMVAGVAWTGLH